MITYKYEFESFVLAKKILKTAKKQGFKPVIKDGFEFKGQFYIGLEKFDGEKDLFIETLEGEFWRIPLSKDGPEKGRKWWPSQDQVPTKDTVKVLKKLYAFLKA